MSQTTASSSTVSGALAQATFAESTTASATDVPVGCSVVREPSAPASAMVPQDQDVAPTPAEHSAQEEPAAADSAVPQEPQHADTTVGAEAQVPVGDVDTQAIEASTATEDAEPTPEDAEQAPATSQEVSQHADTAGKVDAAQVMSPSDDADEGFVVLVAEVLCLGHSASDDVRECVAAAAAAAESCADDGACARADGSGACEAEEAAFPAPSSAADDELGAPSAKKLRVELCADACAGDVSA